eukprot:7385997-Alexandrium_andersonii.AAC.1
MDCSSDPTAQNTACHFQPTATLTIRRGMRAGPCSSLIRAPLLPPCWSEQHSDNPPPHKDQVYLAALERAPA